MDGRAGCGVAGVFVTLASFVCVCLEFSLLTGVTRDRANRRAGDSNTGEPHTAKTMVVVRFAFEGLVARTFWWLW